MHIRKITVKRAANEWSFLDLALAIVDLVTNTTSVFGYDLSKDSTAT
ncbi:MAG TPA: hypothetical protein HPP77_09375 [Candidatus Hydrogenedentes bacterium]|nr:hypothetical protein [Candidatus Hydrogenedentota bacterium]HIJ73571.1 hypothetical protein [Candidatus Hydrogenedentota bacterium]